LKKIVILGAVVILMSCSSATVADDGGSSFKATSVVYSNPSVLDISANKKIDIMAYTLKMLKEEEREKLEQARTLAATRNANALKYQISELSEYIDKTRYVFSGSTPAGWDCSGLVVWFYGEMGIELPHSATKQGFIKPKSSTPMPGDIVVFQYNGAKNFVHSGIYIGNNQIIHAGFRAGMSTAIIDLDDPAFDGQTHYFVRLMDSK
jgi:cell wall-associated NlpC family hydrolase